MVISKRRVVHRIIDPTQVLTNGQEGYENLLFVIYILKDKGKINKVFTPSDLTHHLYSIQRKHNAQLTQYPIEYPIEIPEEIKKDIYLLLNHNLLKSTYEGWTWGPENIDKTTRIYLSKDGITKAKEIKKSPGYQSIVDLVEAYFK